MREYWETVHTPDRITANLIYTELLPELAKLWKRELTLDSNMAKRVALWTIDTSTYALEYQITEYMSVRELYCFVRGLMYQEGNNDH